MKDHRRRLLLVEDREDFATNIVRWLETWGYYVERAKDLDNALHLLDSNHYHVAIVDARLDDDDEGDRSGFEVLKRISELGLQGLVHTILLTAYPSKDDSRPLIEYEVTQFVQKDGAGNYRSELKKALAQTYERNVKINFELAYFRDAGRKLQGLPGAIHWPDASCAPSDELMTLEIQDIFGRLFRRAKRVHIAPMQPGLTGCVLIRVRPELAQGVGRLFAVKLGPKHKITVEENNFREYVRDFLVSNTVAQAEVTYTRHLGAILYTFAENEKGRLREFDEHYVKAPVSDMIAQLDTLFSKTCAIWYGQKSSSMEYLPLLYLNAFNLTFDNLATHFQRLLPRFSVEASTLSLPDIDETAINPLWWLMAKADDHVMNFYSSITHGDLTGRNIMVDRDGCLWLIDFYRTYRSPLLRDFVIFETDVKYRLLKEVRRSSFLQLEAILNASLVEDKPVEMAAGEFVDGELDKAAQLLIALRRLGLAQLTGRRREDALKEYMLSLLMATLNVVRLRHIDAVRKVQAISSASMLCAALDQLDSW